MSKHLQHFRILLTLALPLGSGLASGCASAPPFEPTKKIDRAGSLQESLILCDEYRMPEPAQRPVALKPFVSCVQSAADEYPLDASPQFETFRKELEARYDLLREEEWTPRLGSELAGAIHALLRSLWRGDSMRNQRATAWEKQQVLRHFPISARAVGAVSWLPSAPKPSDPNLENLTAEVTSLEVRCGPARTCQPVISLKREVSYLSQLWGDLADMKDLREPAPESVQRRYERRLADARAKAEDLKSGNPR